VDILCPLRFAVSRGHAGLSARTTGVEAFGCGRSHGERRRLADRIPYRVDVA